MEITSRVHVGEGVLLQSKDHRDLLDIIDNLRSQGISRFVDLPQIIVCGDQSSGKSSVLEAISGMSFPTKDNLCTRFATELILRRNPSVGVKVHINPGPDRSNDEKRKLGRFTYKNDKLDIGQVVEDAKVAMGLTGNDKVFSTDILRVEISGPSQPHLTMVDLPGLFLAGNKDQSEADAKVVESLVLSYMKKPRSIILAVVSAKSDFALQQVTRHARILDPRGTRTLGLITKPDTLDEGSDSERFFVELAQNKDVEFRLGWHVLRNRSYAEREASTADRDGAEIGFFSKGIWTVLEAAQLGVKALKVRLSNVLRDQIIMQLPSVLGDVATGIKQCQDKLAKLGVPRVSVSEQRRYLLNVSTGFSGLLKAAVDGVYTDGFFAGTKTSGAHDSRLRAVVQNTLLDFAELMRVKGHARIIDDEPVPIDQSENPTGDDGDGGDGGDADDRRVSRSDYIAEVKALMRHSRGRELPGTYNPLIVAELFGEQCKPWRGLVYSLAKDLQDAAYTTVNSVLKHIADERTAGTLLRGVVSPSMETLKESLFVKLEEILEPHLSGHPITYNHYLTENVQKAQAARNRHELERQLTGLFGQESLNRGKANYGVDVRSLLNTLASHTEPDMDKFSCYMAADMMEAYYKVALKKVIDDVSILAIEKCLIQRLPGLLSPDRVCDLTDEEVQRIAGESTESATERARTLEKLRLLETGMAELERLKKHNLSVLGKRSFSKRGSDSAETEAESEPAAAPGP